MRLLPKYIYLKGACRVTPMSEMQVGPEQSYPKRKMTPRSLCYHQSLVGQLNSSRGCHDKLV